MVERHTIGPYIATAIVFAAVLAGLLPIVIFAFTSEGDVWLDPYVWRVARFTLVQASLSTALSVVPAIFTARAFARRGFPGRSLALALFAVPLALPAIVAVLGIVKVYGQSGWFGGWFTLYGLVGILLAHVFFNLPLATRMLLEVLQTVSVENRRLAAQLGFDDLAMLRHVDWPAISSVLSRVCALIFLLCASSFVVVLTLGGGPQATTLEVAIFQSLRMDFDIPRAMMLSFLQIGLSVVLVLLIGRAGRDLSVSFPVRMWDGQFDGTSWPSRFVDYAVLIAAIIFVALPLLAILVSGVGGLTFSALTAQAILTSLAIATPSAMIGVGLAYLLAASPNPLASIASLLAWIVPPAVIATGWFLLSSPYSSSPIAAGALIVALNSLVALPFCVAALAPALARTIHSYARLNTHLGLSGWTRFRVIDLPALRGPIAYALLVGFVLSLGDLTAIALLGNPGIVTLPSLISQQMGSYRGTDAGGTALLLAALCFGLTLISQRTSRHTC